ncbi:MAG: hypothetical protein J5846_06970 [Desulfovibrio sp.]|nr:hypothetical protein [Desulfovibrio sp.]
MISATFISFGLGYSMKAYICTRNTKILLPTPTERFFHAQMRLPSDCSYAEVSDTNSDKTAPPRRAINTAIAGAESLVPVSAGVEGIKRSYLISTTRNFLTLTRQLSDAEIL